MARSRLWPGGRAHTAIGRHPGHLGPGTACSAANPGRFARRGIYLNPDRAAFRVTDAVSFADRVTTVVWQREPITCGVTVGRHDGSRVGATREPESHSSRLHPIRDPCSVSQHHGRRQRLPISPHVSDPAADPAAHPLHASAAVRASHATCAHTHCPTD